MKKSLLIIPLIILLGAWFLFSGGAETEITEMAQNLIPEIIDLERVDGIPPAYRLLDHNNKVLGYFGVGKAPGYGGPLQVAVVISPQGKLTQAIIVDHKETPGYYKKVVNREKYLEHFNNKYVGDTFELGKDLDGVSGATITCRAIADATRQTSHYIGREQLQLNIETKKPVWEINLQEIVIILLLSSVIILTVIISKPKTRQAIVLVSTLTLGFWLNRPISITQISGALLGFFPSYYSNLIWYVLLGVGIGLPLLVGRNIYCYWLCPFGGVQELANKISGINLTLGSYERQLRSTRNILLWASLLIVFIARNPNLGGYEPFGTMFGFTGTEINWLMLFVVLTASMFISRFWCKYFCPVGAFLDLCAKLNRQVSGLIKKVSSKKQPGYPKQKPAFKAKKSYE